jgi:hypothetical protein
VKDCTPYSDRAIIEATKKECERNQLALLALRDSEDLGCSSQENTILDETNENSSNIGNSSPDVSITCFVLFNIFYIIIGSNFLSFLHAAKENCYSITQE